MMVWPDHTSVSPELGVTYPSCLPPAPAETLEEMDRWEDGPEGWVPAPERWEPEDDQHDLEDAYAADCKMPTILEESMEGSTSFAEGEQEACPSSIAESGFEEGVTTPSVTGEGQEVGFFRDIAGNQQPENTAGAEHSDNVFESDVNTSDAGSCSEGLAYKSGRFDNERLQPVGTGCCFGTEGGVQTHWSPEDHFQGMVPHMDGQCSHGNYRPGPTSTAHGTGYGGPPGCEGVKLSSTPGCPNCNPPPRYTMCNHHTTNNARIHLQETTASPVCVCTSSSSTPQCPSSPECNACVRAPDVVPETEPEPSSPGPSPPLHVCRGCAICHSTRQSGGATSKKSSKRRTAPSGSTGSRTATPLPPKPRRPSEATVKSSGHTKYKDSARSVFPVSCSTMEPAPKERSSSRGAVAPPGGRRPGPIPGDQPLSSPRPGRSTASGVGQGAGAVPGETSQDHESSLDVTFTADCRDCHGQIRFIQCDGESLK